MKKYDVFVIGSGMAGMTVANKCASQCLEVGITDELPYGGTCTLRGCDPKKVIIGVTEVRDFAMRLKGKGVDTVPDVNWQDIMAFKQSFVDAMPTVVFTLPTMASVGMTETKAKNSGLEFWVSYDKVDDWFNARRLNVEEYAYKTIIDKNMVRFLVHILSGYTVRRP